MSIDLCMESRNDWVGLVGLKSDTDQKADISILASAACLIIVIMEI